MVRSISLMPFPDRVLTYDEVRTTFGTERQHVLLGNGFSIECDPIFGYSRLYDAAVEAGLSDRAQAVFNRLGTNNFERVMRLLEEAHWVAETYGLIANESQMLQDVEIIKTSLVEAVSKSHLPNVGRVPEEKRSAALEFLRPYHNIFTTNYDLLPYWVNMHAGVPIWKDGFHSDEDDPDTEYVVFSERLGAQRGLYYIHGALHLFVAHGELRKHTWVRSGKPLTQLIQEGLAQGDYPLFVAEGTSQGKLEQIQRTGYLWYCLDKLARIEGPLVVTAASRFQKLGCSKVLWAQNKQHEIRRDNDDSRRLVVVRLCPILAPFGRSRFDKAIAGHRSHQSCYRMCEPYVLARPEIALERPPVRKSCLKSVARSACTV